MILSEFLTFFCSIKNERRLSQEGEKFGLNRMRTEDDSSGGVQLTPSGFLDFFNSFVSQKYRANFTEILI